MTPLYDDGQVTLYHGDVRTVLGALPSASVQTIVTSPPYYQLRDYGVTGQIGLEISIDLFIDTLVAVFREARRLLRDDGTLWINIGDSYANGGNGLPDKSLLLIPARLALALQADGWLLRSDIIWAKPNPMPESVQDRPTSAHEHIFLLAKANRYYYDAAAIREPAKGPFLKIPSGWDTTPGRHSTLEHNRPDKQRGHSRRHDGFNERWDQRTKAEQIALGANKRDVWTVATHAYPQAHFATFPPKLITPCILAGAPDGGVVLDPFIGSGTTAEVAKKLGRKCLGIDLNRQYLTDYAIPRCQQRAIEWKVE